MTTCSTLAALGMMPLLLFIYCHGFSNLGAIPYGSIILALFLTLLPCATGIYINYRIPQYSKLLTRVGQQHDPLAADTRKGCRAGSAVRYVGFFSFATGRAEYNAGQSDRLRRSGRDFTRRVYPDGRSASTRGHSSTDATYWIWTRLRAVTLLQVWRTVSKGTCAS